MSDVVKVAAAAIVASVCAVMIRKQAPEIALLLAVCAGALILLYASGGWNGAVELMQKLIRASGLAPELLTPVIRVTGIALVTRLAADVCKDAGEGALASAVETAGTAISLLAVVPLMSAVLDAMTELL